ncbi:class I adenylate-forming enzyme family protein [Mycobacterium vicinigordonae]|uniref:Long-chain-fatty-acid--CoA ligase FadD13 n=1 Tax=Mycobacterium vicinigordonae TaxID=1719132 RepID=A0A7D6I1B4_9MYCO|nr:AMP-binding protein [Mycobacterium vicinigordonae]QLL10115.1 AMP-binding protein [Mycobacterium vicinigordonae]
MTLGDIVTDNAVRFTDVPAYRHGRRSLTHAQLRERAVRLVSAMVGAGVRHQDRIAVLSRNSIEFGELIAATQLSGVIMATINFRLAPVEMRAALARVSPSLVFCADEFVPALAGFGAQSSPSPRVVTIGGERHAGQTTYEDFLDSGQGEVLELVAHPGDIACLLFTSGTTGASKCCILGQQELRRVALTMNGEMRCGSGDRGLINMPMFHVGGLAIIAGLHARGGTVVLQQQFAAAEAVRLIADERITVLHLAPVMVKTLLDEVTDISAMASVHTIVYAAAPMSKATLQRALGALPGVGFLNLYGQTEAIVSGLPRELHTLRGPDADRALSSVGYPFPGTRVRIVDDDGVEMPTGETGEIVVTSDALFRGYWDDHAATLTTLRDGWCHTGDIGRIDERGLLYLVDRKKDVVISGGENVYSPEVEDAVNTVAGVAACAVIGIPDDRWGEAVCAVVVAHDGMSVTLEEIQRAVRERLAGYKVPRRLVVTTELPLLATGKVDKKRLRGDLANN